MHQRHTFLSTYVCNYKPSAHLISCIFFSPSFFYLNQIALWHCKKLSEWIKTGKKLNKRAKQEYLSGCKRCIQNATGIFIVSFFYSISSASDPSHKNNRRIKVNPTIMKTSTQTDFKIKFHRINPLFNSVWVKCCCVFFFILLFCRFAEKYHTFDGSTTEW